MSTKTYTEKIIVYLLLIIFAAIMILPFYWTILTSFRPDHLIFSIPIKWLPQNLTLEQYIAAFHTVPYFRYFANSLYLASMGVITNLFFGSLGGYAFAKLKFRGRKIIFLVFISALMIPGVITMIPQFIMLRNFPLIGGNNILGQGGSGMLNSYWAIILPGAAGPFAVFLMRQYFRTLPDDYAENARIEGAGEFKIFWNIYLPLIKPAIAALSVFTFQAGWNNFMWPMIILSDPKKSTIQMGLQAFSYNYSTNYGPLMAASIIATIPILALFVFAQRYFIQGLSFSGIKA